MTDQFPQNHPHPSQPEPQPQPQPQPAPKPAGYQRPSPETLRARRLKREEGFEFVLHATTDDQGNPTVVRARRPDLFDADNLASLPDKHQRAVFDLITYTEQQEGKAQTADEREALARMGVGDMARQFGNMTQMADAYVLLGFMEPRVYATAAEADEKGGLWIKDIELADRIAFMNHVDDARGGAAEQVSTFPSGPDGAVDAGPAGTPVSGAGVAQPDHPPTGPADAIGTVGGGGTGTGA